MKHCLFSLSFLTLSALAQVNVNDLNTGDPGNDELREYLDNRGQVEKAAENNHQLCIPPGTDTEISIAVSDKDEDLSEQPVFGCAVILCLASMKSVEECDPVWDTLYSSEWLYHRRGPRWPSCDGEDVRTEIKDANTVQWFGISKGCALVTSRKHVKVFDTGLDNYYQKMGKESPIPGGIKFMDAKIPWQYNITDFEPRKRRTCPEELEITFKPQDVRHILPPETETTVDTSYLESLPVCGEPDNDDLDCIDPTDTQAIIRNDSLPENERLPVCEPSCIDPTDKVAIEINNKKPLGERLLLCGTCDVDDQLLSSLGIKNSLFTWKSMRSNGAYKMARNQFVNKLNGAMVKYNIKSCYQKAHFLAQTIHETAYYQSTIEGASGKAYNGRRSLGNDCSNDGPRFKGRGLIQLTGRYNYWHANIINNYKNNNGLKTRANCSSSALKSDTAKVKAVENMSKTLTTAGHYWTKAAVAKCRKYGGNLNRFITAHPNDVTNISKCVNGGTNGLSDRRFLFKKIKKAWGLK